MRAHNHPLLTFLLRSLWIFAMAAAGVTTFAELCRPAAFTANAVTAANGNAVERQPATARGSASYRWNLDNDGMPLVNLPERIGSGLDQSLTYAMGQFEFPLFQSLYYNARARKYVVMVIANDDAANAGMVQGLTTRRAEFVELARIGTDAFAANGKLNLRLEDQGALKVMTTGDGTVYRFGALRDGEFHCRQINDRHGAAIALNYTDDALLANISDDRGRTITFNYTNDYVSSVAQTWLANAKRLRKTWMIEDEIHFAHVVAAVAAAPARLAPGKHMPSNAIRTNYTQAMAASDSVLAAIFGGPGAIAAANGFEPVGLGQQYPLYRGDLIADDGRVLRGHLSFAMHLYGSADGTRDTELYIPAGFTAHSDEPSPTDAVMTFYYPRLGNLTDVTLAVFHVRNFHLSYVGERVHIGSIGGPGGSIGSYRHSHLEFYRGNTGLPSLAARQQLRIDPATVFGSAAVNGGR